MKKSLFPATIFVAISIIFAGSAQAGDNYVLRVYCKGQSMHEIVINAPYPNVARESAERQNPGCKVILIGKAK